MSMTPDEMMAWARERHYPQLVLLDCPLRKIAASERAWARFLLTACPAWREQAHKRIQAWNELEVSEVQCMREQVVREEKQPKSL